MEALEAMIKEYCKKLKMGRYSIRNTRIFRLKLRKLFWQNFYCGNWNIEK